jgi:hypothetical protein
MEPVTLTADTLATTMDLVGLGELPLAIRPDALWADLTALRERRASAWQELREAGWINSHGHVNDYLLDALRLLAQPTMVYTGIFAYQGHQDSLVLATRNGNAVLASRRDQTVSLAVQRGVSLAETVVRQIPHQAPARVTSFTISLDEVVHGNALTADRGAAGELAALARQRLVGQGELYVSTRDYYGRRRASGPIRYQDYEIGRVLVVVSDGYLSVAPAAPALLVDRLAEAQRMLLSEL